MPATVPAGTATFGASNTTGINLGSFATLNIGSFQFNAGAPIYGFASVGGSLTLNFNGAGIVNNSSNAPFFDPIANMNFNNNASAGNALIQNSPNLTFHNSSTAGSATIFADIVTFKDNATAGTATIMDNFGSTVFFQNTSSASNATIVIGNGGSLAFTNQSTAGSALITNNAVVSFSDGSSAGNATIVNNSGGVTLFSNGSTAGSATIITNSGGFTLLDGASSGGQARFITNAGGLFDLSALTSGALTVGSIEGNGSYVLRANQLTVGGNNLSTVVGGVISGNGASLVKVGSGTLTLSGANTYTDGTTVTGGLINFAAANNFGTGAITLNGGGLQWAAGTTTDISGKLAPLGASGGVFDTNGNNVAFATPISGAGALIKQGLGTLTLTANNLYSGGTTVSGGLINFTAAGNFGPGAITLNGGGLQWAAGSSADISFKLAPLGRAAASSTPTATPSPSPPG